ncbi:degenerin del-1-like, partial [Pectinophora gossypiella]|uniref:degenerin del-1-like n=1 Tax=Pectinophora gossypiella TaxID=13191 RepID=UPI00214E82A4
DQIKDGRFYEECMTILILKRVVNYCRCIPFRYSAKQLQVEDYVKCTWERLSCIYQTIDKVKSNIQDIVSQNQCLQKCDYIQYEQEVQYMRQNRQFRNLSESYSKIDVHFSSATCLKYKREVLYSWDQMMANLGGIFGLCLGGSIISLLELVWFILDFIFTMWKTLRNRKPSPIKKHVFVVSPKLENKYPKYEK